MIVEDLVQLAYAVDTFYFLVMGAMVMFMAPGFAMLEAGMVRSKNTSEILTKNVALFSIACIMYLVIGYNIMYGGEGLFLGAENTVDDVLASGGDTYYSARSDFFFQVVFVATAMSIISGAVAERMKLWSFLLFAVVMTGFIYPLQGSWSWGGGFLSEAGFVDFAGSGIVHMCGAAAALAGVILLGPRSGKYGPNGEITPIPGSNMPLATLGMFILWFGWFGFNGGSELKLSNIDEANAVAQVFVNTNMAAAGGLVAALILATVIFGKADLTMALNGALAGLVSITAEPLSGTNLESMLIGAVGGVLVVLSIVGLDKIKIDDPVGAISVHGTCGIWGLMAVLITSDDATLTGQLTGLGAIFGFTFVAALVVWFIIKLVIGIRLSEEDELIGADKAEIGIVAYPEFNK
ncbi:MAG: ammonium transporter [Gammaproteobacteria bacterium]|jgi:Amt family ammonium transporter|nr:ammonium transporter [Gammaproteobacteria bacterium]MDA8868267.1 ammonium transporter [Pseudomonadales bacterium]MBT3696656.1 ammonium transporter [Gammaproteobacteria bacterium]MBT5333597.1 ammonium transporter [Gammaproteobacteria bacterium]MBT5682930.1 ammonium transporter [Gammaproteobacteria bacterium]